jgi:hypothetical protein
MKPRIINREDCISLGCLYCENPQCGFVGAGISLAECTHKLSCCVLCVNKECRFFHFDMVSDGFKLLVFRGKYAQYME